MMLTTVRNKPNADATDEEQTSDDEAPEEVSTAAATALAGRRRKAELDARKAVPKRKRARASTKGNKAGQGDSFSYKESAKRGGGWGELEMTISYHDVRHSKRLLYRRR